MTYILKSTTDDAETIRVLRPVMAKGWLRLNRSDVSDIRCAALIASVFQYQGDRASNRAFRNCTVQL